MPSRPPRIYHSTSQPFRFFGREAELALLEETFQGGAASVVALAGPGGQGKTAILQQWLDRFLNGSLRSEGLFLWSFYRGKDADLCLRELYAYATGLATLPDVSASYCVDHLLPVLRRERWALLLDGTEVAQYESGPWFGRFLHPELGRLIDELAAEPLPGVVVLTTRFPIAGLERRRHARVLALAGLDPASARGLLESLGVKGSLEELDAAAAACGRHAKAVELLATYLDRFHQGKAGRWRELPPAPEGPGYSDEERQAARVLAAFQIALPAAPQDILALGTAFREPPTEERLREYLLSTPVHDLLHRTWGRDYVPFREQPPGWLQQQFDELVHMRLLERVGRTGWEAEIVLDAHPLVRRGFEHVLGGAGQRQTAQARAGFLRGRPDRRRPATLEQAREEIELFHAYADAHFWNEADGVYVALENPKHRFLAPALETDLLKRFFPEGDWRRPPLWAGFGRYRSLAICFELLGQFEDALVSYRENDSSLRGDALLALGRLDPLLHQPTAPPPWNSLWQAYRAHALCLAGQTEEAVTVARSLVPVDVYEWIHVFECLLRAGRLDLIDLRSVLFRSPGADEHRWEDLARQRMRADYRRLREEEKPEALHGEYEQLLEAYDRGGLPFERALVRLGLARCLLARGRDAAAGEINKGTVELTRRHGMRILEADALEMGGAARAEEVERIRKETNYQGQSRP